MAHPLWHAPESPFILLGVPESYLFGGFLLKSPAWSLFGLEQFNNYLDRVSLEPHPIRYYSVSIDFVWA